MRDLIKDTPLFKVSRKIEKKKNPAPGRMWTNDLDQKACKLPLCSNHYSLKF